MGAPVPIVAQATHTYGESAAAYRHGRHNTGAFDAMGGIGGGLRCCHGEAQEEVVALTEKLQGSTDLLRAAFCNTQQRRKKFTRKQEGARRIAAVQLIPMCRARRMSGRSGSPPVVRMASPMVGATTSWIK